MQRKSGGKMMLPKGKGEYTWGTAKDICITAGNWYIARETFLLNRTMAQRLSPSSQPFRNSPSEIDAEEDRSDLHPQKGSSPQLQSLVH
jgi:hypothetical protein